jgi:hypothetical protein
VFRKCPRPQVAPSDKNCLPTCRLFLDWVVVRVTLRLAVYRQSLWDSRPVSLPPPQLDTCGYSPYVTSSLTRSRVCIVPVEWNLLLPRSSFLFHEIVWGRKATEHDDDNRRLVTYVWNSVLGFENEKFTECIIVRNVLVTLVELRKTTFKFVQRNGTRGWVQFEENTWMTRAQKFMWTSEVATRLIVCTRSRNPAGPFSVRPVYEFR